MNVRLDPTEAGALVRAACNGDRGAWNALVDHYVGLIWAITRAHRLADGDAHDVAQTTWLRLVEHIDRLTDPEHVGAWLATTARRECLRVLRQSKRTVLLPDWDELDGVDLTTREPGDDLLRSEQTREVRAALEELSPSAQALLRLLMLDPPPSYDEISAALGIPIGSIGPTRGRALRKLQTIMLRRGITYGGERVFQV